jgi:hypothetical protein
MSDLRLHLVLGLAVLMLLTAFLPGLSGPDGARAVLTGEKASRPEPIEVEPIGLTVRDDEGTARGW